MKNKPKFGGSLTSYLRWPLLLSPLLLFMNLHIYYFDKKAGLCMTAYFVIYVLIAVLIYYSKRAAILRDVVNYAVDFGQIQSQLLKEMALPYAILDTEGHLLWANDEFIANIDSKKSAKKNIANVIPELTSEFFPTDKEETEVHLNLNSKHFKGVLRHIVLDEFEGVETQKDLDIWKNSNTLP